MTILEPVFDFSTDESSVLIHKGEAELCIDGNSYAGEGEVRLDLLPQASIRAYGNFQGIPAKDAMEASFHQKEISSFSISSRQIEGFLVSSGGDLTAETYNIKWCPKSETINGVGAESTQMKRVVFHLFNFVDLIGARRSIEKSETTAHAIEHIDLINEEWKIELKSLTSTPDNFKALKEEGGYRLTHIGGIQKADGALFSGKEADECLQALRYFLSFAKGGWCRPICAVGFDASDSRVWECWLSPREPWRDPLSWFDPHNGSQLAALFPGFMRRWADDDWRDALGEAIYWYLIANDSARGTDAGIILTQAAIERLSFEYSAKDRRLITVEGFKNLWASDKFRLLFSSLKVPLDILTATPELQKLASQMNWVDAPHALTELRNSFVHPEHKNRGRFHTAYFEAWNLGLWYLEMGILAICGYSGNYGNRLKQRWIGQVENVPWE